MWQPRLSNGEITLYGMYREYKKRFRGIDRKCEGNVDYHTYRKVVRMFNEKLSDALINECLEYKMQFRLGKVRIRKCKMKIHLDKDGNVYKKQFPIDWVRTKELWKRLYPGLLAKELEKIDHKQIVYNLNEHTDGYQCILYWNKRGSNVTNNRIYSLRFTRGNNRKLARALKTNNKLNYYE